jgi:hypothetical protein
MPQLQLNSIRPPRRPVAVAVSRASLSPAFTPRCPAVLSCRGPLVAVSSRPPHHPFPSPFPFIIPAIPYHTQLVINIPARNTCDLTHSPHCPPPNPEQTKISAWLAYHLQPLVNPALLPIPAFFCLCSGLLFSSPPRPTRSLSHLHARVAWSLWLICCDYPPPSP